MSHLDESIKMTETKLASVVAYAIKQAGGTLVIPLEDLNHFLSSDFDLNGESDETQVTLTLTELPNKGN